MWTHIHELAFRLKAPAHILKHEDIACIVEFRRRTKPWTIVVLPIRRHTKRRALDEEWIRLRLILWNINLREKCHAIPHGNVEFVLLIACPGRSRRIGAQINQPPRTCDQSKNCGGDTDARGYL